MDKWEYITKLSNLSTEYGDLLLDMMLTYDKESLLEVSFEECKEYYDDVIKRINELELIPIRYGVVYKYIKK